MSTDVSRKGLGQSTWTICIIYMAAVDTLSNVTGSWSRMPVAGHGMYSAAGAVLITEVGKLLVSWAISSVQYTKEQEVSKEKDVVYEAIKMTESTSTSPASTRTSSTTRLPNLTWPNEMSSPLTRPWDVLKVAFSQPGWYLTAFPAAIYVAQNNLRLFALDRLNVVLFNLAGQLKIPATAFMSILLLRVNFQLKHWGALILLLFGLCIIQLPNLRKDDPATSRIQVMRSFMDGTGAGLLAMLLSAFLSALAGVYLEKVLKTTPTSIWIRQLQLCVFSLIPAAITYFLTRGTDGIFDNYDFRTWSAIASQILGGLSVAIVIKYADNMVKLFAVSLSSVTTALIAALCFQVELTTELLFGGIIINAAAWLYGRNPPKSNLGEKRSTEEIESHSFFHPHDSPPVKEEL